MESGETLVFGHRGAMACAPMNTLASFQLAYEQGADGVELDVHLSRDRQLIVLHDFSVDATTEAQGAAADFTLAELKELDAGSWYSSSYALERIPTLDEVFDHFGDKLLVNVEVKSRFSDHATLVESVAECIRRRQMAKRTIVSSFDPQLLQHFRAVFPEVMIGFLHPPGSASTLMDGAAHEARHPWHETIDQDYMTWARESGFFVNAWTVNDAQRACALGQLGVNSIITDHPAHIISAMRQC